jgi:hypothetical protein
MTTKQATVQQPLLGNKSPYNKTVNGVFYEVQTEKL